MVKQTLFFLLAGLAFSTGSLRAEEPTVFTDYVAVQKAMAQDDRAAWEKAAKLLKALSEERVEVLRKEAPSKAAELASFEKISKASGKILDARDEKEARQAMSGVSSGVIALLRADAKERASWQLYFCPMHRPFGYWVQPKTAPMENPYMGEKSGMLTCGSRRSW